MLRCSLKCCSNNLIGICEIGTSGGYIKGNYWGGDTNTCFIFFLQLYSTWYFVKSIVRKKLLFIYEGLRYGNQFTSSTYLIILNYPLLQEDGPRAEKQQTYFYYYKKIGLYTAVPRTRKKEVYVHPQSLNSTFSVLTFSGAACSNDVNRERTEDNKQEFWLSLK